MKIAVAGAGVSGLVAAYGLGRRHAVTVFESDARLGGHIHTVPVSDGLAVDTGFIVFNRPNYPLFNRLLQTLEVGSRPTTMSFSVQDDRTGVEYSGHSLDSLFAQRGRIFDFGHWKMLADVRRFMKSGAMLAEAEPDRTTAQFLEEDGYSEAFAERFLIPLAAALWSCPRAAVREFPIRFVAEFLKNHSMLQLSGKPEWRTVVGGSKTYLEALLNRTHADFRTQAPVERIVRTPQGVRVSVNGSEERFDEVIVAAHADQALAMLEEPSAIECALLSAFPYQKNDVVLHTDSSRLPKNRRAWASWNYRVPESPSESATVTYCMNRLMGLETDTTYCVSLNETAAIDPNRVIGRYAYHHPAATVAGVRARMKRSALIRHRGVSYAGAYWGYGFHEDGVRSAVEVLQAFGEELS